MAESLPPIHEWWPRLSEETRGVLTEYPHAPLVGVVRDEIARVTGEPIDDGTRLSEKDAEFIRSRAHTAGESTS